MSFNQRLALASALPIGYFLPQTNVAFAFPQSVRAADFTYRDSGEDEQTVTTSGATIDVLTFEVEATVNANGEAPEGLAEAGLLGLINRIEIRGSDRDTPISISPTAAVIMQRSRDQVLLNDELAALEDFGGEKTCKATLTIDLRQLGTNAINVTGIDGRNLGNLKVKLKYAGARGIFREPKEAAVSDVSIKMSYEGTRDDNRAGGFPVPYLKDSYTLIDRDQQDFTAYELDGLPAGTPTTQNKWLKGIFVYGMRGGVELVNAFDDDVDVQVKIGATTVYQTSLWRLREMNKRQSDDYLGDALYIDFIKNGDLRGAIPLTAFNGQKLTIELGVKNIHPGETAIYALPDMISFFQTT